MFHKECNPRSWYRVRDSYFTTGRPQRCGGMLRHGLHDLPAKERARVFFLENCRHFCAKLHITWQVEHGVLLWLILIVFNVLCSWWNWSQARLGRTRGRGGLQQASNCGSLVEQRSDPNTVNTKWSQVTYQSADCCAIFSRLSVISWNNFYGCHHDMWSHCRGDTMKATSFLVSLSIHFFLIQKNVFDQC